MHAWHITEFGLNHLTLRECDEPEPGPGQVRVSVAAVSLNYRDLLVVKGQYNPRLRLPLIPGSDGVGEVTAVGCGVSAVRVGDRVAGCFFPDWVDGPISEQKTRAALGGSRDGVLATSVVLQETGVLPVPAHLTDEEAATLPCAALTAWNALVTQGGLTPGQTVLTLGTGGVSLFALQFARMCGAEVIATSSSDAKLTRARELGASAGINYLETPDWDDRVRRLTGGIGVDHVVEVGGAGTLERSLRAVRMGGAVSLIGVLAGYRQANPVPILMKNIRLQGVYVGSRDMFVAMNRAIALHQLRPVVDRVFPFADTPAALHHLESAAHFGKVCIRVPS